MLKPLRRENTFEGIIERIQELRGTGPVELVVTGEAYVSHFPNQPDLLHKCQRLLNGLLDNIFQTIERKQWIYLFIYLDDFNEMLNIKVRPESNYLSKIITILFMLACGVWDSQSRTLIPDPETRVDIANILVSILKKNKKFLPSCLVLDLRPLLEIIASYMFPLPRTGLLFVEEDVAMKLLPLCRVAKRWFPNDNLIETIRRQCGNIDDDMRQFICLLGLFLPPKSLSESVWDLLSVDSKIWKITSRRIERIIFAIMARLCKFRALNNPTSLSLAKLDTILGIIRLIWRHFKFAEERSLVRADKSHYSHLTDVRLISETMPRAPKSLAKIIISLLKIEPDFALQQLSLLMASLDSYFHPSNTGPWTDLISEFHSSICLLMAKYMGNGILEFPASLRNKFCTIVFPAAEKLSLSKRVSLALIGAASLKHLAFIANSGQVIVNPVIREAAYSLSSLSEPFRTVSYIHNLSRIARNILESIRNEQDDEEYYSTFFGLLPECVVGIDPNDHLKTMATLSLFCTILSLIELKAAPGSSSIIYFEELTTALLEQSFSFIKSLSSVSHHDHGIRSNLEGMVAKTFGHFWSLLFNQMPTDLWTFAFSKTRKFLLNPLTLSDMLIISQLGRFCKGRNTKMALDELIPLLVDLALNSITLGIGAKEEASGLSCSSLIWPLACLAGLLRQSGPASFPHLVKIMDLVSQFLDGVKQPDCVKWMEKIVKACYRSLLETYPITCHSTESILVVKTSNTRYSWHSPDKEYHLAINQLFTLIENAVLKNEIPFTVITARNLFTWWELVATASQTRDTQGHYNYIMSRFISVAFDETVLSEIRTLALHSYRNLSLRSFHKSRSSDNSRSFIHSWMLQLQSYPKQKELPTTYHNLRCRWIMKRYKLMKQRIAWTHNLEHLEQLTTLCGHPLANIREAALLAIQGIYRRDSDGLSEWINNKLVKSLYSHNDEYHAKAIIFLMNSSKVIRCIGSNFETGINGLNTLIHIAINFFDNPDILPHANKLMSMLALKLYPIPLFIPKDSLIIIRLKELLLGEASSWKIQLACLVLLISIAQCASDPNLLGECLGPILESCVSANVEIRSLAVNRSIILLEKLKALCGSAPTTINASLLLEKFFPLLLMDIRDYDRASFRSDCTDFLCLLLEQYEETRSMMIKLAADTLEENDLPLYRIRGLLELIVALIRSAIACTQVDKLDDEFRILQQSLARGSGVDSLDLWYDAGYFLSRDLDEAKVNNLLMKILQLNNHHNDAIVIPIMRLTAGILKNYRTTVSIPETLLMLALHNLYCSSDLLRVSSAKLLFYKLNTVQFEELGQTNNGLKSLLIIAELLSLEPVESDIYTKFIPLLDIINRIVSIDEVVMQKEAQRVMKVLSGTAHVPNNMVLRLLERIPELIHSTSSIISQRSLLNFVTEFFSKNSFQLNKSQVERLFMTFTVFLQDKHLEIRHDCRDFLALIFHTRPELTTLQAQFIIRELDDLTYLITPWEKHSCIMKAAALIKAFPYTIPEWMPSLLATLARFFSEAYPVSGAVQKIFSEFKRTHEDSWERDREKFTENELDAINELLVAPSYYA